MEFEALGPDIWVADGPTALDLVIVPYPTRMTVVRLADGGLWVSSPIASSFDGLERLRRLGPVGHLVAATPRHIWRLEHWHELFPEARLWTCAKGPATLGGRDLPAAVLRNRTATPWREELPHAVYPGIGFEETTFFRRPSRTLLVEDIVQCHEHHPARPALNRLIRFGGVAAPGGVPRDVRAITRRDAARRWAERVLSSDFDRLVMAHGPIIRTGAKRYLEARLDWLLTPRRR